MIHPLVPFSLILLLLSIMVILYLSQPRILISIVTIDRDAHLIPQVYKSISHILTQDNIDCLIVCRETDTHTQSTWKSLYNNIVIATIKHYAIENRHNIDMISTQRNITRHYASKHGYDYILFLDSDIIINHNTLSLMLKGCEISDICLVPYTVRWLGYPGVCTNNNHYELLQIEYDDMGVSYESCVAGGMGCTLIPSRVFNTTSFQNITVHIDGRTIMGEDIGFFQNILINGYTVAYVKNHKIKHI